MPQVTIDITATGDTTVQVTGLNGPGCKQLTAAIEAAVGTKTSDQPTSDMHRAATQKQEQRA